MKIHVPWLSPGRLTAEAEAEMEGLSQSPSDPSPTRTNTHTDIRNYTNMHTYTHTSVLQRSLYLQAVSQCAERGSKQKTPTAPYMCV